MEIKLLHDTQTHDVERTKENQHVLQLLHINNCNVLPDQLHILLGP